MVYWTLSKTCWMEHRPKWILCLRLGVLPITTHGWSGTSKCLSSAWKCRSLPCWWGKTPGDLSLVVAPQQSTASIALVHTQLMWTGLGFWPCCGGCTGNRRAKETWGNTETLPRECFKAVEIANSNGSFWEKRDGGRGILIGASENFPQTCGSLCRWKECCVL